MATSDRRPTTTDLRVTRNDVRLRGVADDGQLEAIYTRRRDHPTITDVEHVSLRLAPHWRVYARDGVLDPASLTDYELSMLELDGGFEYRGVDA